MAYETDVYISLYQLGLVHLKRGVPWTAVAPREARRASPPPPCSHEVEIVIPPSHVVSVLQILVRQYLAKWGCTTRCRVGVALAGHADQHLVQHLVQHLACVCPACGLLSGRIEGWMRFSHLQFVHYSMCTAITVCMFSGYAPYDIPGLRAKGEPWLVVPISNASV